MLSKNYVHARIQELRSVQLQKELDLQVLKGQIGELEIALSKIIEIETPVQLPEVAAAE